MPWLWRSVPLILLMPAQCQTQLSSDCFTATQINEACCSASPTACVANGIPTLCDSDCANVFVPWYTNCRATLAVMPGMDVQLYDHFVDICGATNSEGSNCELEAALSAELENMQQQLELLRHEVTALRSTTCCEDQSNWNGRFTDSAVCGFSPRDSPANGGQCVAPVGLLEAEEICIAKGGRLCSASELLAGEASSTGCQLDNTRVWSKTAAPCSQGFAISTTDREGSAECTIISEPLPVRCCADFCGTEGVEMPADGTDPSEIAADGIPPALPASTGPGYTQYGADPDHQSWAAPPPPGAKNVLMIVVDDLRPELHELFGKTYMQTPNLDQFGREALGFRRAFVQQAICGASRASFLTGRRPETTRIYDLHTSWRDAGGDFVSIGQMFAEAGFATRGFGKLNHPVCGSAKQNPGECDPLAWTLPYFHAPSENRWTCTVSMAETVSDCRGAIPSHYSVSEAEEAEIALPDTQIANAAIDQLAQFAALGDGDSTTPFFLGVGFHKPHLPFVVPERHVAKYPIDTVQTALNTFAPSGMPKVAWSTYGELRSWTDIVDLDLPGQNLPGWDANGRPMPNATFPDATARSLRQHYFAAVSYTDEQVGRVLDALGVNGYASSTITILFGDHGVCCSFLLRCCNCWSWS